MVWKGIATPIAHEIPKNSHASKGAINTGPFPGLGQEMIEVSLTLDAKVLGVQTLPTRSYFRRQQFLFYEADVWEYGAADNIVKACKDEFAA